jgi:hypothetical protein
VTFSEPVERVSGQTIRVRNLATGKVIKATIRIERDGAVARVTPRLRMYPNTRYEVIITKGIRDGSLNALAPTHWFFRTGR